MHRTRFRPMKLTPRSVRPKSKRNGFKTPNHKGKVYMAWVRSFKGHPLKRLWYRIKKWLSK